MRRNRQTTKRSIFTINLFLFFIMILSFINSQSCLGEMLTYIENFKQATSTLFDFEYVAIVAFYRHSFHFMNQAMGKVRSFRYVTPSMIKVDR